MSGCRAINDAEIELVKAELTEPRDYCLFILGIRTGFRISELLKINVPDVVDAKGRVYDRVTVSWRWIKEKRSREVLLHPDAQEAIRRLMFGRINATGPLFKSRNGEMKPLSRFRAYKILKDAFGRAGLRGALATHTLRKTFAQKMYENLGRDILATRDAIGHRQLDSTLKYISTSVDRIRAAILKG